MTVNDSKPQFRERQIFSASRERCSITNSMEVAKALAIAMSRQLVLWVTGQQVLPAQTP
jgi:hypothetical protein